MSPKKDGENKENQESLKESLEGIEKFSVDGLHKLRPKADLSPDKDASEESEEQSNDSNARPENKD